MKELLERLASLNCPVDIISEVAMLGMKAQLYEELQADKKMQREKWAELKRNQRAKMSSGRPVDKERKEEKSPPYITPSKEEKKETTSLRSVGTKGSRIPQDWHPGSEGIEFAERLVGTERTTLELAKFKDYWIARAGQLAVKRDWPATWRNWVRKASETQSRPVNEPRPGSFQDRLERHTNVLRKLEEYGNDPFASSGSVPHVNGLIPFRSAK